MSSLGDRRWRKRRPAILAISILALLAVAAPAWAASTQSSLVLIRADDVVGEDLYALGQRVQVDGTIEGDLVAIGVEEVRITGTVTGSVTAAGSEIIVDGTVQGSLRVVAGTVSVTGDVGGDVFGAAWMVDVGRSATIGRDVEVASWTTSVVGSVGRDLHGRYRSLSVGGRVGGRVEVDASRVDVAAASRIGDDLAVRSRRSPTVAQGAEIGGDVLDRRPISPNVRVTGFVILFRVLAAIGTALAGLALMWSDADPARAAVAGLRARPLRVSLIGIVIGLAPFLVIALLFGIVGLMPAGAALPLLGFAIPISIGLITVLAVSALLAPIPPAVAIGSVVASNRSVFAQFLLGVVVLLVASFLPLLGWWLIVAAIVVGFGAWMSA